MDTLLFSIFYCSKLLFLLRKEKFPTTKISMVGELTGCLNEVLQSADEVFTANVVVVYADHACEL